MLCLVKSLVEFSFRTCELWCFAVGWYQLITLTGTITIFCLCLLLTTVVYEKMSLMRFTLVRMAGGLG